jgi:hypothetical protein
VTDRLRSYDVAQRELVPDAIHDTSQYANNRAELSHHPTRLHDLGRVDFCYFKELTWQYPVLPDDNRANSVSLANLS